MLSQPSHLRTLNLLRDLPAVADLVELCFGETMDAEGHSYVDQMRKAGRDHSFLRWALTAIDTVSMPLSGYVWEEAGRVIGNVSLIPFVNSRKKVYLIANVVVHPDHRRKGIARALTTRAMQHALQRQASAVWLHVREKNDAAIALYRQLGFHEVATRTTWKAIIDRGTEVPGQDLMISKRKRRDWPIQKEWLQRLYPAELDWYQPVPWNSLRPGLSRLVDQLLVEFEFRQWAAYRDGKLLGALAWRPVAGRPDQLWAAIPPTSYEPALKALLLEARRTLIRRSNLALDLPAALAVTPLTEAGFQAGRTLTWMQCPAPFSEVTRKI